MGIPRTCPVSFGNIETPHKATDWEKSIQRISRRHFWRRSPLRLPCRDARGGGAVSKTLLANRSDGVMAFAARVRYSAECPRFRGFRNLGILSPMVCGRTRGLAHLYAFCKGGNGDVGCHSFFFAGTSKL